MSARSDALHRKAGRAALAKMQKVECFVNTVKAGDYFIIPADKDVPAIGRAVLNALIPAFETEYSGNGPDANSWDACSEDCPFNAGNRCTIDGWPEDPTGWEVEGVPGPDCPAKEA